MQRFVYRFLSVFLSALLIIGSPLGVVKLHAAETVSLKSKEKVLYLGGCRGATASGKKAAYYSRVKVRNLVSGFDKKKYYIDLKSSDNLIAYADDDKDIVYASGTGKTKITVTVRKKTNKKKVYKATLNITVMENADPETFVVEGIEDGQTVYAGDLLTVTLPGTYTDKRTVLCDDENVTIHPLSDGKTFEITFDKKGEYTVTAAAYQSKKYDAFTASEDFDITVRGRRAEVIQQSADSVLLKGELVDEDIDLSGIMLYEDTEGTYVFRSYASGVTLKDEDEAEIVFFESFDSEKKYRLNFDGIYFDFVTEPSKPADAVSFEIAEHSVRADENVTLSFRYYNASGLDITAAVKNELDKKVSLSVRPEDANAAFFDKGHFYIVRSGLDITVLAELTIGDDEKKKTLKCSKVITSLPAKGTTFTGNILCSLKHEGENYLAVGEKCINAVPLGDNVVFEALFEMDDGSYKTFQEAGITSILIGDQRVALSRGQNADGGYALILNKEGKTGIIIYKDKEVVGTFHFEVLPERKPDRLTLDVSRDHLNTDPFVSDYIMIKADLLDQYGSVMENAAITAEELISGPGVSNKLLIHEMAPGRFMINGWECMSGAEQSVARVKVTAADLTEEFKLYLCDYPYDPADEGYTYKLETEGSFILDNSVGLGKNAPKSTFVTVKISKNGYYVGEGLGYIFSERPIMRNTPESYGVAPGESFYGILIEHTSEKGVRSVIGEDEACIIPSYMDIEFVPYVTGERLAAGTYDITIYSLKAGDGKMADINICDKVSIRVVDTAPEIEVIQRSQTYNGESWGKDVTKYFTFTYEGEDIGKYITKVDCAESVDGAVFVRSVDFLIPNPYFGEFTKTAKVERLITKQ
ncbi:MAG: hypothetical protein IK007_07865 [Lachnospiraceae bacterium]|nr:hypothetical protein [Lachnospiraceae bacterium]